MYSRKATAEDFPRLKELFHAQGFTYEFPKARDIVAKQVICDSFSNEPVLGILARQTVELYMLADRDWRTPAYRFCALDLMHERMRVELEEKGISDAHVWIPPERKNFGRRLMRDFGWRKNVWDCYSRETSR